MGTEILGASGPGIYFINYSGFASWDDPRNLQANIYDVSLSTDGYAYSTGGNRLYVFNKEKNMLFSLNTASAVWRLSLSPEGAFIGLATSSPDNRIYLYDRNESLRWTYDPKNTISDIDVTYQAGRIAAGAGSNLYFFSRDGALLGAYDCGSQVNGVSLTRDGSRAAVGLQDGNVKDRYRSWRGALAVPDQGPGLRCGDVIGRYPAGGGSRQLSPVVCP
jgi:WD40 repeat protein